MSTQILSCQQLAQLAGVSVRTLHHYDRIGLLKPSVRTEARYRQYGPAELLRLQQILFYKELDFPLGQIRELLDDPDFDQLGALTGQERALQARAARLRVLLATVAKTIAHIKKERPMLTNEELYEGFPREQAEAYRREAGEKYGPDQVAESEEKLRKLGPEGLAGLHAEREDIARNLSTMLHLQPDSLTVQAQIGRHFANIRGYWGPSVGAGGKLAAAYEGLARLYLDDPRFTQHEGQDRPEYAAFLSQAMLHFSRTQLHG